MPDSKKKKKQEREFQATDNQELNALRAQLDSALLQGWSPSAPSSKSQTIPVLENNTTNNFVDTQPLDTTRARKSWQDRMNQPTFLGGGVPAESDFSNTTIPTIPFLEDNTKQISEATSKLTNNVLAEKDRKAIEKSEAKIKQLQTTTGDAMLDEAIGAQGILDVNKSAIQAEQAKIDKINNQTLVYTNDNQNKIVDDWLNPDYKMTDSEVEQAKQLVKDYEINSEGDLRNNFTPEERERMSALKDKISKSESAVYGVMNALPGMDALGQMADDNYYGWTTDDLKNEVEYRNQPLSEEVQSVVNEIDAQIANYQKQLAQTNNSTGDAAVDEAMGLTGLTAVGVANVKKQIDDLEKQKYKIMLGDAEDIYGYKARKENARKQNPLPYYGGDIATRTVETVAGNALMEGTQYGQYLDDVFNADTSRAGKIIADSLKDAPIDLATDTLPEYLSNKSSGMSEEEVNKQLLLNIALNMGINLGVSGVQNWAEAKSAIKNATKEIPEEQKKVIDDLIEAVDVSETRTAIDDEVEELAKSQIPSDWREQLAIEESRKARLQEEADALNGSQLPDLTDWRNNMPTENVTESVGKDSIETVGELPKVVEEYVPRPVPQEDLDFLENIKAKAKAENPDESWTGGFDYAIKHYYRTGNISDLEWAKDYASQRGEKEIEEYISNLIAKNTNIDTAIKEVADEVDPNYIKYLEEGQAEPFNPDDIPFVNEEGTVSSRDLLVDEAKKAEGAYKGRTNSTNGKILNDVETTDFWGKKSSVNTEMNKLVNAYGTDADKQDLWALKDLINQYNATGDERFYREAMRMADDFDASYAGRKYTVGRDVNAKGKRHNNQTTYTFGQQSSSFRYLAEQAMTGKSAINMPGTEELLGSLKNLDEADLSEIRKTASDLGNLDYGTSEYDSAYEKLIAKTYELVNDGKITTAEGSQLMDTIQKDHEDLVHMVEGVSDRELSQAKEFDDYMRSLSPLEETPEANVSLSEEGIPSETISTTGALEPEPPVATAPTPEVTKPEGNNPFTSGDTNYSKVYTNTLTKQRTVDMQSRIDQINATYDVHHRPELIQEATDRLIKDYDKWDNYFRSAEGAVESDIEVHTAMQIVHDKQTQIDELIANGADQAEIDRLVAEKQLLQKKLRYAGTKSGQEIKAFDYWNGTPEGAVLNAQRLMDTNAKKWADANKGTSDIIDDLADKMVGGESTPTVKKPTRRNVTPKEAKKRTSKKLDEAISRMWKTTEDIPGKPKKTHDQIRQEVINSLEKEFGSIDGAFTDTDIDYLTNLVEERIPVKKITSELESRLGDTDWWYTLDESIDLKKTLPTNKRIDNAIETMGVKPEVKSANKETHYQLMRKIGNSFETAYGKSAPFTDDDLDFFANMLESNASKEDLQNEIARRLRSYAQTSGYDPVPTLYPEERKLQSVINELEKIEVPEKYVSPELTYSELRERVKNTIEANKKIAKNFDDTDIDYLAHMLEGGATSKEVSDMLKTKISTGSFDIPEEVVKSVTDTLNKADTLPINSKARVELEMEAWKELANASMKKATIAEKFDTWRYLAMLGNPKTHVRNVIGNALFQGVTRTSDTMAAAMEEVLDATSKKVRGKGIEKTKTFLTASDNKLVKACGNDALEGNYRALSGTKKYGENVRGSIKQQRDVFDSKIMRKLNDFNSDALEKEDFVAMKAKYQTSLAGYLKANGLDESVFQAEKELADLKKTAKMRLLTPDEDILYKELTDKVDKLNKGRDYAVKKAEYSAFHEDNAVSDWITNNVKKAPEPIRKMVEGVIPFAKTPANILKSGLEYSPLNIVNDAYRIATRAKKGTTASEIIEGISKTITGTGLVALGALLHDRGVLNSSDEETKWQDDLEGIQNYSLTIGGKTFTIDFAAPSVMPLLLGAEVAKLFDPDVPELDEEGNPIEKSTLDHLSEGLQAVSRLSSPIMETSMMSGINDTLETLSQGDALDALGTLALNTTTGYFTQGIPTLLGQIARTVDPVRRSTYSDENTAMGRTVDKQATKTRNKIPFLSMLSEPYEDVYARKQNNSPVNSGNNVIDFLGNAAYQLGSPSYIRDINTTDVDEELRRLYDVTKDAGVFFDLETAPKNGGRRLSKEDYTTYTDSKGKNIIPDLREMFETEGYKNADDDTKLKMVKGYEKIVKNKGKEGYLEGYDMSDEDKYNRAYKEGGIPKLMEVFDDKYGEGKQLADKLGTSYNETFKKILDTSGEKAAEIYSKCPKNESGNVTQENLCTYLKDVDMTDAERGQLLKAVVKDGKKNHDAYNSSDPAKLWEYYKKEYGIR